MNLNFHVHTGKSRSRPLNRITLGRARDDKDDDDEAFGLVAEVSMMLALITCQVKERR
jgi:hypothetical protein